MFYRETPIKAVRKARRCTGCRKTIAVGEEALNCVGNSGDGFWSGTYHKDCREAEVALNDLHDIRYPDEWNNLADDMPWEDWPWLIENFPAVAERMGITAERHDEIAEQHRVRWFARTPATPKETDHG
tara:strand:- start:3185 stop:3568 length:384 start_codon:yes stop_codon:yes gene_type:complete